MRFNDLDLSEWKNIDINTDSLWMIANRSKDGLHKNVYHGNFIPQIPNELLRRYTKKDDVVLDPFLGSGTTLYECKTLGRKCIGLDLNEKILKFVKDNFKNDMNEKRFVFGLCDSSDSMASKKFIDNALSKLESKSVQFVIMHPPYLDIVKFTDKQNDLSQISDMNLFCNKFLEVCQNILCYLDIGRYFAIVIGDAYKNSEINPLGFYIMDRIKRNFNVKLKGIIVKNIEGNRGKLKTGGIWRYRAISSDYYIFKHEYIFVFKKEK